MKSAYLTETPEPDCRGLQQCRPAMASMASGHTRMEESSQDLSISYGAQEILDGFFPPYSYIIPNLTCACNR